MLSDLISPNFFTISFSHFTQYFFDSSFNKRILTPISAVVTVRKNENCHKGSFLKSKE